MGLLDDAIREHLDLKRSRGADPAEVERAEQEALGPVRRGPVAEPPELVLDEAHQPEWDGEYEDEQDAPAVAPAGAVPFDEADTALEPRPGIAPEPFDEDPFGDEGFEAVPSPERTAQRYDAPDDLDDLDDPGPAEVAFDETTPPPHRAPLPRDQLGETVEYDVEEALGEHGAIGDPPPPARAPTQKPPAGPDEDPLEETPEFLQETPDHDRLWFEQRPPRDFDFDG